MNAVTQLAAIAVVSLAAAGGTWLVKGPPPQPAPFRCDPLKIAKTEICLEDVKGNVLWVDSRLRSEWEENGLEGSVLWNMDAKENQNEMEAGAVMRIAGGVDLVVVYCSSEACGTSKEIADLIRRLDLGVPVKSLNGGWDALKDRSKELLRDSN